MDDTCCSTARGSDLACLSVSNRECCLDEPGVGEGLRIVAKVVAGDRVHFLGVQSEGRRKLDERAEPLPRLSESSALGQGLDQPERAWQERALGAGEAVPPRRIAVQKR